MTDTSFCKDSLMRQELSDGLTLVSAPERDFGINYAIYRNANPEFEDFLEYGSDLEGLNYCFWVLKGQEKIGGIIIRPNHIEGLFLRPPHTGAYEVLRAAMNVLLRWSDRTKPIEAVDVLPHELELYQRLGFRFEGARRVYIRPTETFDIRWDDNCELAIPTQAHREQLAAFFQVCYSDYPAEWELGSYTLEQWLSRVDRRLNLAGLPEICRQASTLVYDRPTRQLIGACLIRPSGRMATKPGVHYPRVCDIAVHPQHRRRGLGGKMLKKALTVLAPHYSTLRFGVAVGNAAEAFYYQLGFIPGITQSSLVMPPTIVQAKQGENPL